MTVHVLLYSQSVKHVGNCKCINFLLNNLTNVGTSLHLLPAIGKPVVNLQSCDTFELGQLAALINQDSNHNMDTAKSPGQLNDDTY